MGQFVTKVPVLDHGFVILRNLAGPTRRLYEDEEFGSIGRPREFDADDIDPANAARMSFDQMDAGRTREDDLKLCEYLIKNKHTSPFEMVQIWIEMKIPIFVARQLVRHRTARLNEMSARYVTLPEEWYIPEVVGGKAPNKKQGQEDNLSSDDQSWFKMNLNESCYQDYQKYLEAIDRGIAPEHARLLLHLNHYTHWIWNQDLHNIMHLLMLRDHGHAQIEAQKYTQAIIALLRMRLPNSMALFDKYVRMK